MPTQGQQTSLTNRSHLDTFMACLFLGVAALLLSAPLEAQPKNAIPDGHEGRRELNLRLEQDWQRFLSSHELMYEGIPPEGRVHFLLLRLEDSPLFLEFLNHMLPGDSDRPHLTRREFNELLESKSSSEDGGTHQDLYQAVSQRAPTLLEVIRSFRLQFLEAEISPRYSDFPERLDLLNGLMRQQKLHNFLAISGAGVLLFSDPGSLPFYLGLTNLAAGTALGHLGPGSSSARLRYQKITTLERYQKLRTLWQEHGLLYLLEIELANVAETPFESFSVNALLESTGPLSCQDTLIRAPL